MDFRPQNGAAACMKLYDAGRAPNPRRVRIFLAEKGLSVPLMPVDLGKLEHKAPAFVAVNPLQRTPALELDDGTVLTESIAICRYFEELHPEPPLFGTDALSRAQVEMWQRRLEFGLLGAVAAVFRHLHPAMAQMEAPQVAAWGETNKPKAIEFLRFLDGQLDGRTYICGDRFTVADITGLVGLDFMKPAKLSVPDELSNVRRWHETLAARPSAQA
jgi:glutathione S-transferase